MQWQISNTDDIYETGAFVTQVSGTPGMPGSPGVNGTGTTGDRGATGALLPEYLAWCCLAYCFHCRNINDLHS